MIVTVSVDCCYGHRLMRHQGKCRHAHGHNARVEVEFEGELDAQGFVIDFSLAKSHVKALLDSRLDHRFVLEQGDCLVPLLEGAGQPVTVLDVPPTAENLARWLLGELAPPVVAVTFWETPTSWARATR